MPRDALESGAMEALTGLVKKELVMGVKVAGARCIMMLW